RSERLAGIWITLVIAASPEIATAASVALAPERFTARRMASPTALASTMAFSFTELGGVGSAAYASTRSRLPLWESSISLTEEVVMSRPRRGTDFFRKSTVLILLIQRLARVFLFGPEQIDLTIYQQNVK